MCILTEEMKIFSVLAYIFLIFCWFCQDFSWCGGKYHPGFAAGAVDFFTAPCYHAKVSGYLWYL